ASTHAGAAQQARSASRASSVPSTWNRASPASSAVTPESYAAEGTGASPAHPGTSGSVISRRHRVRDFRLEPSAIGRYKVRRLPALLVVCLAVFVDMLGFGIILPLLPFHIASLGGSGVWLGAIMTAYAAAQFLAAPVLGALSDRYGRRRLLVLSLAGSAVSMALTGLAGSLPLLLAARLVAGGCGGSIAVAQAYVVELVEPRNRLRALGAVGASIGFGFVVGPAIGAGLAG